MTTVPSHMTPVLGYASQEVIGHWDEIVGTFVPLTPEALAKEAGLRRKSLCLSKFPLVVNVSKRKTPEGYVAYRSVGTPTSRSIIVE
jgi:hypothetical protein